MDFELEIRSREDFDKQINRQRREVEQLRTALKRADRQLNWLREGLEVWELDPKPDNNLEMLQAPAPAANGTAPPESITGKIAQILAEAGDPLPIPLLLRRLRQREWISDSE